MILRWIYTVNMEIHALIKSGERAMPDISMCSGIDCPLKESCYRAKATPSEFRQAWFCNIPYDHEKEICDMHIPTGGK